MKKYVKIMADYLAEGVWDHEGACLSIADVPLHATLQLEITDWQATYDRTGMDEDFDVVGFSVQGLALAREVKRQLPEWTVMYFDEAYAGTGQNRTVWFYEILAS